MNRVFLTVAFLIAASGPVASSAFRNENGSTSPLMIAGQVDINGNIRRGSGFTAERVAQGEYRIHIQPYAGRGCLAMTVTPVGVHSYFYSAWIGERTNNCKGVFNIYIGTVEQSYQDSGFAFIAVQD
jgi:hypothetical protein